MDHVTIYDQESMTLTDGLQSGTVCDAAFKTAQSMAQHRGQPVIVEDHGLQECYQVNPDGSRGQAPAWWIPDWELAED